MTAEASDAPAAPRGDSVRMRVAGAVLAAAGVLLAASTTVWPTMVLAVRVPEVGDFTKGYEQRVWSWGRQVVYSVDGLVLDAYTGPNPVGRLVLLVAVLLLAAAGVVAWVAVPGRRGELIAAVGMASALAVVAASVVERLSFDGGSIGLQPGLVEVTTTAGWLEVAAVWVLLVALAVLVVPVVLPSATAAMGARARRSMAQVQRVPTGLSSQRSDVRRVGDSRGSEVGFSDASREPAVRGRLARRRDRGRGAH